MSKGTLINVLLLVVSIGLAVAGQLVMKSGMRSVVAKSGDLQLKDIAHPVSMVLRIARDGPLAIVGIILYAISAVFWLIVLSRVDLSVAYPLVAVGYVIVVLYSWLVFKEDVRWFSWIGLLLIVIGVIITAQGLKSKGSGHGGTGQSRFVETVQGSGAGKSYRIDLKNNSRAGYNDESRERSSD